MTTDIAQPVQPTIVYSKHIFLADAHPIQTSEVAACFDDMPEAVFRSLATTIVERMALILQKSAWPHYRLVDKVIRGISVTITEQDNKQSLQCFVPLRLPDNHTLKLSIVVNAEQECVQFLADDSRSPVVFKMPACKELAFANDLESTFDLFYAFAQQTAQVVVRDNSDLLKPSPNIFFAQVSQETTVPRVKLVCQA